MTKFFHSDLISMLIISTDWHTRRTLRELKYCSACHFSACQVSAISADDRNLRFAAVYCSSIFLLLTSLLRAVRNVNNCCKHPPVVITFYEIRKILRLLVREVRLSSKYMRMTSTFLNFYRLTRET
jgi:hypothetical protein